MLLDANILLYAIDDTSPRHSQSRSWLEGVLNGDQRVAIPWQTIGAVARIATHPRVMTQPLSGAQVADLIDSWLACPVVWIPTANEQTASILLSLLRKPGVSGNLVTDAQLAALAIHHGLKLISVDTDFARFPDVDWVNPIKP